MLALALAAATRGVHRVADDSRRSTPSRVDQCTVETTLIIRSRDGELLPVTGSAPLRDRAQRDAGDGALATFTRPTGLEPVTQLEDGPRWVETYRVQSNASIRAPSPRRFPVTTRRQFLVHAPLGLAGALAACRGQRLRRAPARDNAAGRSDGRHPLDGGGLLRHRPPVDAKT